MKYVVQKDQYGCAWVALCNIWKRFNNGVISVNVIDEFEKCSAAINKKNFLLFFDYLDFISEKLDVQYYLMEHKTHLGLCKAIAKEIDSDGFFAFIVHNDTPHVFLLEKTDDVKYFKAINMYSNYDRATRYIKRTHFFTVINESRKYFPFLVFYFRKSRG